MTSTFQATFQERFSRATQTIGTRSTRCGRTQGAVIVTLAPVAGDSGPEIGGFRPLNRVWGLLGPATVCVAALVLSLTISPITRCGVSQEPPPPIIDSDSGDQQVSSTDGDTGDTGNTANINNSDRTSANRDSNTPVPVKGLDGSDTGIRTDSAHQSPLTTSERPAAPNGRTAPDVADDPIGLADQITAALATIADPQSGSRNKADAGHMHQVAIRKLGYQFAWDPQVFEALPEELVEPTLLHVSARRALIDLSSGYDAADFIPAWKIQLPEPVDLLLSHYKHAEAQTGIGWEYLAAINLIETGMGRILGPSSAGAQGPMQFLASTWDEPGIGEGDIYAPSDAIAAAARYLVRRGGPTDMAKAIWGYNNSDNYVIAVSAYAELLRSDSTALETLYNWEIYFYTEAGDIWLPVGFQTAEQIDLTDFLAKNPWSKPDINLRNPN